MIGLGINAWRGASLASGSIPPPPLTVPNQTALFPSVTPANAAGFQPFNSLGIPEALTGAVTRVGGPALTRTWSINGSNQLVADGTPLVDHGVILRCNLVSGGTVDITIDATTHDGEGIGTTAEWDSLVKSAVRLGGKTHVLRCRDFDNQALNATGQWVNTLPATIRAERLDVRRPIVVGNTAFNSGIHGALNFVGINFYEPQTNNWDRFSPIITSIVVNVANKENVTFNLCRMYSNYQDSGTGYFVTEAILGLESRSANTQLIDCEIDNVMIGVRTGNASGRITLQNTDIHHTHGDAVNTGGGAIIMIGGFIYSLAGMGNNFHADLGQFNGAITGNIVYNGRTISFMMDGVRSAPGPLYLRRPAEDPIPGRILTLPITVNTTLDVAVHAFHVAQITAAGVTITLPAASSVPIDTEFFILVSSTGCIVQSTGGDLWTGGALPLAAVNTRSYSFISTGTGWKTSMLGIRNHTVVRTVDATLFSYTSSSRTNIVDTSSGNKTFLLPAAPVNNGEEYHFQVLAEGAGTVTILPQGAHTIRKGGVTVPSIVVSTIRGPATLVWDLANTRWNYRGTHYGNQGIFSNANQITGEVYIRGCVIAANEPWALRVESANPHLTLPPFMAVHHNVVYPYQGQGDISGDGVSDEGDGKFSAGGIEGTLEVRGQAAATYIADRNAANYITPASSMTHTNLHILDNDQYQMNVADSFNDDFTKIRSKIKFTNPHPATLAEIIDGASRPTGYRTGQYFGPDDWRDPLTNVLKTPPNMTVSLLGGVFDSSVVRLRFSQPLYPRTPTGNVTLFNVTDGVTVETFSLPSAAVSFQGDVIVITPTTPLTVDAKTYSVRFASTCFPSLYDAPAISVSDNSLSFVVQPIVYPSVSSFSSTVREGTAQQFESNTFTLSGSGRYVIQMTLRSTGTSDPIATFTRGTPGRAYGTGTPVTVVSERHHFAAHSYVFLVDPTTSPGAETLQIQTAVGCNNAGFEVIEVTNCVGFGAVANAGVTSSAPAISVTNQSVYSTLLALPMTNAAILTAGAGNTALYVRTPQAIHSYAAVTRQTPNVGLNTITMANSISAQTAITAVELKSV